MHNSKGNYWNALLGLPFSGISHCIQSLINVGTMSHFLEGWHIETCNRGELHKSLFLWNRNCNYYCSLELFVECSHLISQLWPLALDPRNTRFCSFLISTVFKWKLFIKHYINILRIELVTARMLQRHFVLISLSACFPLFHHFFCIHFFPCRFFCQDSARMCTSAVCSSRWSPLLCNQKAWFWTFVL